MLRRDLTCCLVSRIVVAYIGPPVKFGLNVFFVFFRRETGGGNVGNQVFQGYPKRRHMGRALRLVILKKVRNTPLDHAVYHPRHRHCVVSSGPATAPHNNTCWARFGHPK